jgi:hypothetical protein
MQALTWETSMAHAPWHAAMQGAAHDIGMSHEHDRWRAGVVRLFVVKLEDACAEAKSYLTIPYLPSCNAASSTHRISPSRYRRPDISLFTVRPYHYFIFTKHA